MQLGTPQTIQTLLASIGQLERGSRHRVRAGFNPRLPRVYKAHGCAVGCACRTCSDNARWERIFQDKFADPTYYSNPATRNGSSLSNC